MAGGTRYRRGVDARGPPGRETQYQEEKNRKSRYKAGHEARYQGRDGAIMQKI